ncbi:MAG: hypothetical protein V4519_03825 [Patescibacteria group bacterium]
MKLLQHRFAPIILSLCAVLAVSVGIYITYQETFIENTPRSVETSQNASVFTYKISINIKSKEHFVTFLKEREFLLKDNNENNVLRLDNFKDQNSKVNWHRVLEEVKTEIKDGKTFYSLTYIPTTCFGYTITASNVGDVTVNAKCGI